MPNYVHIIAVPRDEDALSPCFRFFHRRYTSYVNAQLRVTGHLRQGRFSSAAIDEAHLASTDDHVLRVAPALERAGGFRRIARRGVRQRFSCAALRKATSVGRTVDSTAWLAILGDAPASAFS